MPTRITPPGATHRTYSFGEFTLDVDRGALVRAGRDVKLRPKSFEVLRYLVERQGLLVSRDELLDAIWGRTIVTEDAVTQCLRDIRKALRDRSQQIIRTVPRRGYIFELPVTESDSRVESAEAPANGEAASRRPRWPLAAAVALLLGVIAGWWGFQQPEVEAPATDVPYTIAVLPFLDMSPEHDQGYFADSISEEILNRLAWIPELRVIARTSSFSFKDKNVDIDTIAEKLNATHVLEGSVRRSGKQVRITAKLIDASESTHVWSRTYDRELTAANLFYIQSEIGRAVSSQLKIALSEDQEQRLETIPTDSMEAYSAYLIGRQRLTDRKVKELGEAAEHFATAVALDPNFAGAYSGLADACFLYFEYSGGHVHEDCPAPNPAGKSQYGSVTVPLARKAIDLDPDLGEAWISLGFALDSDADRLAAETPRPVRFGKRKEARAAFERGLSLNPSYAQGYLWYANFLAAPEHYENWEDWFDAWKAGKWQSVVKRGLDVDPLSITLHHRMSEPPMWARTKEEALHHAHRIVEIAPDSPTGYVRLGELSWMQLGRIDESIRWTNKAAELDPQQPAYAARIAYGYATLGDVDIAMAYWQRAVEIVADDLSPGKMHILRALILLSNKDGIPMQQVRDALEPLSIDNTDRMEIEANLAIVRGEAKDWFARHKEYFSECLEAEIDHAYANKWRECGVWLDELLLAVGEKARARAAVKNRMEWDSIWQEFWGRPFSLPRETALLGEEDKALEELDKFLTNYRGNPHMFRLYLYADLRFMLYHDPAFSSIRDHPRFQALVAEVEADLARQLENVREMERSGELPTLEELRAELSSGSGQQRFGHK